MYPAWALSLGWAMALSSIVTIPIYAIGKLCLTKGTLRQVGKSTHHQISKREQTNLWLMFFSRPLCPQRLMVLWHPADGSNPNTEHTAKETELQHLSAPPS